MTLVAIGGTGILASMDMSITNISFPALTRIFDTDTSVVLWVSAIYSLVSAGFTPIFGRMGDVYGRKKLFILGLILFTIGLGICAVSQSIGQLILARAVQGVGGAITTALSLAIVTEVFPDQERGRAMGIMSACFLIGPLIGPTIGGLLLDSLGWRSIFYFRLPLCAFAILMAWVLLREQKISGVTSRLDYWGAALLVSGISCLVLYLNLGGRISFGEPAVLALAATSVVLLVVFVIKARTNENSIVDLSLFKDRVFTGSNLAIFLHSLSLSIQTLVVPYYLIDGRGFSTVASGLMMSIAPVFIIGISPVSGWLSDKFGSRVLCPVGMGMACVSLYMLSRVGADSTVFQILLPQAFFGIGDAIFIAPITSVVMGASPRDKLGMASALMNTIRTIAMAGGTVVAGVIFTSRQAFYTAELAAAGMEGSFLEQMAVIGGFQDTVLAGAIVLIFATVTTIVGLKQNKQDGQIPA